MDDAITSKYIKEIEMIIAKMDIPDVDVDTVASQILLHTGIFRPLTGIEDKRSLREWWHDLLRDYGKYDSYALFLYLPSDNEAVRYMKEHSMVIDLLSGMGCLVIGLSTQEYHLPGKNDRNWENAIDEQAVEGYSIAVANLLNIPYTEFPCLVFFEDIRTNKNFIMDLKGLSVDEISSKILQFFTLTFEASRLNKNPIDYLAKHGKKKLFKKNVRTIAGHISEFAGNTFEAAMDAWIKKH